jgi:hypothetical protein
MTMIPGASANQTTIIVATYQPSSTTGITPPNSLTDVEGEYLAVCTPPDTGYASPNPYPRIHLDSKALKGMVDWYLTGDNGDGHVQDQGVFFFASPTATQQCFVFITCDYEFRYPADDTMLNLLELKQLQESKGELDLINHQLLTVHRGLFWTSNQPVEPAGQPLVEPSVTSAKNQAKKKKPVNKPNLRVHQALLKKK